MSLRKFLISIFILLFQSDCFAQDNQSIDFSALNLDLDSLKGARYSLENSNVKIVYHSLDIVDISKVNVETMSIRIEFHLRQRWKEETLKLPKGLFKDDEKDDVYVIVDLDALQYVWSPDSYLPNARDTKIASISASASDVRIYKGKIVTSTARMYTVLGCNFGFQWYPLDRQNCDLCVESYTWPAGEVNYEWEPVSPVTTTSIELLQYDLKQPLQLVNGSTSRFGREGKHDMFPYVKVRFTFERKLGHVMIQVFTPTTLVVILSWFSFWLGLDAVPGRISLLITSMLTLVTMHGATKKDLPPVNYIKMMDIWLVTCIAMVFGAISEFLIVKVLQWKSLQKQKEAETKKNAIHSNNPSKNEWDVGTFESALMNMRKGPGARSAAISSFIQKNNLNKKSMPIWEKIDRISRFFFPLMFAAFNCFFWSFLFIGASQQE